MKNETLRHLLATIQYRFTKSVQYRNHNYHQLKAGNGVRTPTEILHHLIELVEGSMIFISDKGQKSNSLYDLSFDQLIDLFTEQLKQLDLYLSISTIQKSKKMALIQGPLADILTHTGQLSMLSRLNDKPIEKEDFSIADI